MELFIKAALSFVKLVIDIVKTIPRFFVKFFIVGIFSYPMLLVTGFVEQIDPNLVVLFEYLSYICSLRIFHSRTE